MPPCRPVKPLIAADEFMYVTGTVTSATPASASTSQASSTWSKRRHVRHRAAGGQVGQHDLLASRR